jgi:hypothetical protein
MSGPVLLTREYVAARLSYAPETGEFLWKPRTPAMFKSGKKSAAHECAIWNARHASRHAGRVSPTTGYVEISIDGRRYGAHRLAFVLMTGEWPLGYVDHANRVRTDNRWSNLRSATSKENPQNASAHRDSVSRHVGVSWSRERQKWQASIACNGRSFFLGRFDTEEEAAAAYNEAKPHHHELGRSQ